jgi:hypothetical protein
MFVDPRVGLWCQHQTRVVDGWGRGRAVLGPVRRGPGRRRTALTGPPAPHQPFRLCCGARLPWSSISPLKERKPNTMAVGEWPAALDDGPAGVSFGRRNGRSERRGRSAAFRAPIRGLGPEIGRRRRGCGTSDTGSANSGLDLQRRTGYRPQSLSPSPAAIRDSCQ